MTREEREKAIDLLDNLIGMIDDNQGNDYDFALKKGIEALKQAPCEDAVSRQAVLDILSHYAHNFNADNEIKALPPVTPKGVTVTDFADKCRECGKMAITGKTVTLTPFEIKMMQMSLYHQWFRMTDDNGKAINCEQKSADCVFDLLNRFEKLRAEVEKENEE